MKVLNSVSVLGLLSVLLCTSMVRAEQVEIVDLTHSYNADTVYWPTAAGFQLKVDFVGEAEGGYHYEANSFSTAEHGGTHVDAPIHFFSDRDTADQIPLERLIGEAIVIDVSEQSAVDRDYQVSIEDLITWEQSHGKSIDGYIVLLRTGFGQYWPDREKYMGTAERGSQAVSKLHFPGLHPETASWIVENRNIKAIGIDTPSIDYGQSTLFQSHVRLFEHNVPAFENVANLNQLPEVGFEVIALPMKIEGGSGAPLRIIALLGVD